MQAAPQVSSALGHTVRCKLIQTMKVDVVDWCKFTAAVYEMGANWILCSEQLD